MTGVSNRLHGIHRTNIHPRALALGQPVIRLSAMAVMVLFCGAAIGIKFSGAGEVYLLEPVLWVLVLQRVLSRGFGKGFSACVFFGFIVAGLLTLCGYLIADLVAANEPWQYLKGWGRVVLLIVDCAALMLLGAQDRQYLWWLALGMGVGGIGSLLAAGVPLTHWKEGYGIYTALLVLALAPVAWVRIACVPIAGFGMACMFSDYRSLGAVCLLVAAFMLLHWRGTPRYGWKALAVLLVATIAVTAMLCLTQEQYAERRHQSNTGRYIGMLVAWRAIAESPLTGYGSWAANEKFSRMLRDESVRLSESGAPPLDVGRSLLPHSQFLQAWVEGGLLGLAFFVFYGAHLARGLRWYAWKQPLHVMTPLLVFFLASGLWNLLASPFLGIHRIFIAIAVAVIAMSIYERSRQAKILPSRR
jgi:O-Antigen ligase